MKCGPCPVLASYTLAFALQLRKKHGKTSVRVAARSTQADTVQYKNNDNNTRTKKCPLPIPILIQIHPFHGSTFHFLNINFNITLSNNDNRNMETSKKIWQEYSNWTRSTTQSGLYSPQRSPVCTVHNGHCSKRSSQTAVCNCRMFEPL